MQSSGINKVGEPKLTYSPQPLKIGMFNETEHQLIGNTDKTVDWVVENFLLTQWSDKFGDR